MGRELFMGHFSTMEVWDRDWKKREFGTGLFVFDMIEQHLTLQIWVLGFLRALLYSRVPYTLFPPGLDRFLIESPYKFGLNS